MTNGSIQLGPRDIDDVPHLQFIEGDEEIDQIVRIDGCSRVRQAIRIGVNSESSISTIAV